MTLTIPSIDKNNSFLKGNQRFSRNFVRQMSSGGFLPVIALEACVEAGRTYQAYKRGGFDEARERITEEFMGAVFWLGGVTGLNWVFEKIGQAILKLPNVTVDIADDEVRTPFKNYLKGEKTKNGLVISEKMMTRFKFIKVLSSVLIANAFIGFALPKINQAITRNRHRNAVAQNDVKPNNFEDNSFIPRPTFAQFYNNGVNINPVFKGLNLLTIASNLENKRNWKLLSVDIGTSSGRVISARNNDERIEIAFRDLASIYFYMFCMPMMNGWLNRMEHGKPTRLDPVSAEFASQYMKSYIDNYGENISGSSVKGVDADRFAKDMLGENVELPASFKDKLKGDKIKSMTLDEFKQLIREDNTIIPRTTFKDKLKGQKLKSMSLDEFKQMLAADEELYQTRIAQLDKLAEKMSALQPKRQGVSILTESQIKDILSGGHINNPEFLQEFFRTRFKDKFLNKYLFVSQKDVEAHKAELVDYVQSIIKNAKESGANITKETLSKASKRNLKLNAFNWGAGLVTSAIFLSTIIPKLQYKITEWRTGSKDFPGTAQFREEEQKKNAA